MSEEPKAEQRARVVQPQTGRSPQVVLDVVYGYLLFFVLDIKYIKGQNSYLMLD